MKENKLLQSLSPYIKWGEIAKGMGTSLSFFSLKLTGKENTQGYKGKFTDKDIVKIKAELLKLARKIENVAKSL